MSDDTRRTLKDHPLYQMTLCRFKGFIREPEAVFWTFVFPVLMAAGLGLAFRQKGPDKPHIGVIQNSMATQAVASLKTDSTLVAEPYDDSAGAKALRTGKVALLVVPTPSGVKYVYDRGRADAATAQLLANRAIQRGGGRTDPIPTVDSYVSEKGSRYIDFFLPGLLGMNLMGSGIWGIGFAIVAARSQKLLKRYMSTPMRRSHYLLSFMLSRLMFLVLEVLTLLSFGHYVFGVPLRGSFLALGAICLLGAFSFSTLGLLVSSRATTTEGVSGLMNFVMLPMWILSGVFFSSANFPAVVQPIIRALPLTAVNDALRANMLEGASLGGVAPQLAILLAWMIVTFTVALKIFRWR
jgi:ABC-type multidrug transport system permease subunit